MSHFSPALYLIGFFLVVLGLACQRPLEIDPKLVEEEEIIARVDGNLIYRSDFSEYLKLSKYEINSERRVNSFQHFMVQLILFYKAKQEGYKLPKNLIDEPLVIKDNNDEDSAVAQKWSQRFLVVQNYLQSSLESEKQITMRDLIRYYSAHEKEFLANEQLRILEILVKDLVQAEDLREQLEKGDFVVFRDLAKKHSVGIHKNGELGVFERGQLPAFFEAFIFKLNVGEISPIIASQFGYHIFMVEERTPKHYQKFYEVQEKIFNLMLADKERLSLQDFVRDRIKESAIEILDGQLEIVWRSRNAMLG